MPRMVQIFFGFPHQTPSRVHQAEGHLVGSADMAEVGQVFVGTSDGDDVTATGAHAGAGVSSVYGIDLIQDPPGFTTRVVDAPIAQYVFKRRIIERIEVL